MINCPNSFQPTLCPPRSPTRFRPTLQQTALKKTQQITKQNTDSNTMRRGDRSLHILVSPAATQNNKACVRKKQKFTTLKKKVKK